MAKNTRKTKPGIACEGQVADLTQDGRGVVRQDGKAVFVPGTLPGERVRFRVNRSHRRFDEACLDSVLEPSAQRVAPRCPHFYSCGGCTLQHLSPQSQIQYKQQQVLQTLSRLGGVEPERAAPPLRAAADDGAWGYRRRARLGVRTLPGKKSGVLVGFRAQESSFIADLDTCDVLDPAVGHLIRPLRDMLARLSIRRRIPQIEVAVADNATALVFRTLNQPSEADRNILAEFGTRFGLWIYLQSGGPQTIQPLAQDAPALYYELPEFDLRLYFQPLDFIQINAELNRLLVSKAVEWLAPTKQDRVLDLFCGLGNFSLPLARHAGEVIAVEGEAGLVERGRKNARHNGLDNLHFHVSNLFQTGDGEDWGEQRFDKVLLDPPRSGGREILPRILAHGPERIVYVSCHPATLARDVGYLVREAGYRLRDVLVADMFAHTAHVETMALLELS